MREKNWDFVRAKVQERLRRLDQPWSLGVARDQVWDPVWWRITIRMSGLVHRGMCTGSASAYHLPRKQKS